MTQTAVEWLGNEITNRITRRNPHDTIIIQTQGEILIEIIEQAKEMEKKEKIEFACKVVEVSAEKYIQGKTTEQIAKELLTFKSE